MKIIKLKKTLVEISLLILLSGLSVIAQVKPNYLITPNSVGEIRLEMTVAEAKKALSGAEFSPYQCDCAGNFDSTAINERGKLLMTFGTDDEGKIYRITSRDDRYELANGIGHGTPISEAEKKYGRIKQVSTAYDVETAEFTNHPKGVEFIVSGLAKTEAGNYKDWKGGDPREKRADKYNKDAYIEAVAVVRSIEESASDSNYSITPNSVGSIRLGMTVAEARQAMSGAKFARFIGSEEAALISVSIGSKHILTLGGEEENALDNDGKETPVNENGIVGYIEVLDSRYQTADGVHIGMTVADAEKKYGKVKSIYNDAHGGEIAEFTNQPKGFVFVFKGKQTSADGYNLAGIYTEDGEGTTVKYNAGAYISSISINNYSVGESSDNAPNYMITGNSVGEIHLGITVAEARKAMSGAKFSRTSDGDGVALIAVMKNDVEIMTLYANEEDNTAPINENAKIENIEVWSSMYKTADGVHPQMKLSAAEKIYGKVKNIMMSEIESREFAEFLDQPEGLSFRLNAANGNAGIYANNKRETVRYAPSAVIFSITVFAAGNQDFPEHGEDEEQH